MHIYLCIKLCILVPNDGPSGPKHAAYIDDIIKSFFFFAFNGNTCTPVRIKNTEQNEQSTVS